MESFFPGMNEVPSKLECLAKDSPDKCLDVSELDKPIALTQEARGELPEMSDDTRDSLKEKGWSDSLLGDIGSEAEAEIYDNASVECEEINGKDVLVRTDIDYGKEDDFGQTNLERMEKGRAPLDADGRPIELHHIGQKQDSSLAELTQYEHRGKGNDNVLHDKVKESEIDREAFGKERQEHWKERAEKIKSQQGE